MLRPQLGRTQVEFFLVLARLRDHGFTRAEIAEHLHLSHGKVDRLLAGRLDRLEPFWREPVE